MKTNMFNARRHAPGRGPGGWRCTCCGHSPKHRKAEARLHKKRAYRVLDKMEKQV